MKVVVECPGCGAGVEIEPGRRSAELFCARCDYPLFWVTPPRSAEEDDERSDVVLRRRPGAGGIRLPATIPCPTCRELNLIHELLCVRCGAAMQPEPEPGPEPEPVVVTVPPPPPAPEPERSDWEPWMTVLVTLCAIVVLSTILMCIAR